MRYPHVNRERQLVGFYELHPLPGNSQVVVSTHTVILPEFRGKGHGLEMAQCRIARAQMLGYDYMICTVRDDNLPQIKVMEKLGGWNTLDAFNSKYTDAYVGIHGRLL